MELAKNVSDQRDTNRIIVLNFVGSKQTNQKICDIKITELAQDFSNIVAKIINLKTSRYCRAKP
jgi:hypothetical protein